MLLGHWGTRCPVHTWAGTSGPAAPHRAHGCPLPASSLADTPGHPPAQHRARGRGGVWESWTPDSPRPKVTRSAEAAEPWQGPLAQIGGCSRWRGQTGLQPTSGSRDASQFVLCPPARPFPEDAGGRGRPGSRLGIKGHWSRDEATCIEPWTWSAHRSQTLSPSPPPHHTEPTGIRDPLLPAGARWHPHAHPPPLP